MRLSASRIRTINRALGGHSFYNNDKPLPPLATSSPYTHVVFVPAARP